MGLSNYLPSSRIAQPGVCTSSTRPASPFEGQVIYETDTNRVLVYDGSAWVMIADTDTPPGLELIKTQTIGTTVSSVQVTSAFSSTYDNYLITVSGGVASTDLNLRLTLGATATSYYYAGFYAQYSASGVFTVNTSNGTYFDAGYGNANALSSSVELESPNLAKRTIVRAKATGSSTTWYRFDYAGFVDTATQYTDFTFTTSTGTITGGTIRVYGYRNSI